MQPLRLAIGTVRPADVGPLVPVEPEPAQVFEDARLGLARRPLGVGVLDAEQERPVLAVRQQPIEERRAGVPDVQLTGGAGSESYAHTSVGSRQSGVGSRSHQSESSVGVVESESSVRRLSSATAWAAIASPRPTASTPSLVLPFTLTRLASMPSAAATARLDRVAVRSDLRALEDDDDVDVLDRRGRGREPGRRPPSAARCSTRPSTAVGVRVVLPDVAGPGGAEDRVGHRMADDVGIGVPERAALGRHGHAAEDERPAFDQPVQIVADAYPSSDQSTPAPARARGSTSAAVVILTFAASPATTCTRCPARSASMASSVAVARRPASGDRGPEHLAPERLRRLRQKNLLARQGLDDHLVRPRASPYRSPAPRRSRRRARARPDRARDDLGSHKRPRRVVDQHDVAISGHGVERVCTESCRRSPPATSRTPGAPSSHAAAPPAHRQAPPRSRRRYRDAT